VADVADGAELRSTTPGLTRISAEHVGNDALAAGGIVEISSDMLKNFAKQNLGSFLDDVEDHPSVRALAMFASGSDGSSSGVSPSGHYSDVLGGNDESQLQSAHDLKSKFTSLCGEIGTEVDTLLTTAEQFQSNLMMIDTMMTDADTDAKLTAETMRADLSGGSTAAPTA
jgi:hypothetical protein